MKIPWKRYSRSDFGQKVLSFVLPFKARPSEFSGRTVHHLYGRVGGIPLVPLIPAWIFGKASEINAKSGAKMVANKVWAGKSHEEAISGALHHIDISYYVSFLSVILLVYTVSCFKFGWHFFMRKLVDRFRKDGKLTNPAPVQFFIFHTSGIASWFGAMFWLLSIVNSFFPGQQFSTIDRFFDRNALWSVAFGLLFLLLIVKYYNNNTEIFMEIYRNEKYVGRVRKISIFIPILFLIIVQLAGLFSIIWLQQLAQKAQTVEGS